MADGLRALEPDIVLLQEAFACPSTGDDTAVFLGEALGLHVTQFTGRQKLRQYLGLLRESSSNLALLTREPVMHSCAVRLVPCDGDEHRIMQVADVTAFGLPIRLCNAHFTHIQGPQGDKARIAQAAQLAKASEPPCRGLAIFGGDLNATPDQAAIQRIAGATGLVSPEVCDVSNTFRGGTADETMQRQILDYLFLRKGISAPSVKFSRLYQALDAPIGSHLLFPSDHAAVVADLTVS